ncbi:hypothetical protein F4824DRAFT_470357 [Ustulina deusta]|nr:hypothetical protein F4824DRAFT_470357 [Ustulina deusta]
MKIITGAALFVCGVSAQKAVVTSSCNSTIYVQSFPYDGSTAGTLTAVPPGGRYAEDFRLSGSTVKLATTKTLSNPLFFGYSLSSNPDYVYYEFSAEWGNPFADSHNILTPGKGCEIFDCAANQVDCYSTPAVKKVYRCPPPVNLEAELCVGA